MKPSRTVTLIYGDGIGLEVVGATQRIIDATGVKITWEPCDAGSAVFKKGIASGVPQETIESICRTRLVLKGPLETPVGYGEKSANVTLRKLFEMYSNVRPVRQFPGVTTPFSDRPIDFIIVRENVEDLYAGIEYMQTGGVAEALKIISRKGCEKIVRFAFELARSENRKKIHCATKANIMKFSEGLLKRTFEEIALEYPDIEAAHIIVDNCAHQLVRFPEHFDVIVTTNMNGDILSDLGSGLIGGLGFAPGANIGHNIAMFEAVHGSAPKYAGKNVINPSALLLSGVMMLRYLGELDAAAAIENALCLTLKSGVATQDVFKDGTAVSTTTFTETILRNLDKPLLSDVQRSYKKLKIPEPSSFKSFSTPKREIIGIDVFIESTDPLEEIGHMIKTLVDDLPVGLKIIRSRGVKVYPQGLSEPDLVDHFCCRFFKKEGMSWSEETGLELLRRISRHYPWMHVEKLCLFDGKPGFSKAQGED